ncbi:MAG: acyl carrier protein [Parasporobacterium sp.]|nr:acyl carrier protein [Parasporobacterium sp.]
MEFEKLKDIIVDVLNVDPSKITPETKFVNDLGADSLDVFQIIMGIENCFEISIEDVQVEKIVTVQDAVDEIRKSVK